MISRHLRLWFGWSVLPASLALVACQPMPATPVAAGGMNATLSSPLPGRVPLQTPLALRYGVAQAGYASLYAVGSSGQIVQLFDNRPVPARALQDFPDRGEPVIQFGPPPGTERFILVATAQPFRWLAPADYVDRTTYPRLTMDAATFESRLRTTLANLPPGAHEVQRLSVTSF